uniref:Pept_C1 domain-containing protein n=1 Tax=Rhabditophanes sp. KR3021 TaxID=114890 RepID=A0AC35U0N1_9BILA
MASSITKDVDQYPNIPYADKDSQYYDKTPYASFKSIYRPLVDESKPKKARTYFNKSSLVPFCLALTLSICVFLIYIKFFTKTTGNQLMYMPEDLALLKSKFEQYKNQFNKVYPDEETNNLRFHNFVRSYQHLFAIGASDGDAVFELNHFSDWSDDELKTILMKKEQFQEFKKNLPPTLRMANLSENYFNGIDFDWRTKGVVGPVANQGNCGSCGYFSAVGVVESMNAIAGHKLVTLSKQELIDCDLSNHGCSGSYPYALLTYMQKHGVVSEDDYKYEGRRGTCRHVDGARVFVDHAYHIPQNEGSMAQSLRQIGPFSIIVAVTRELFAYKKGVFDPSGSDCRGKSVGLHALDVVGYGNENGKDYWIVKNSWSTSFGEDGYVKWRRGANSCGIAEYACGVTVKK